MAFRLSRLPVNWKEQPQLFERYWDEFSNQLEKTLNAILDIPIIQQAVADAQAAAAAAQTAAVSAQSAANTAQNQTTAQRSETSLVNSYANGFTEDLITTTSAGSITIKNHTRVYGDPTLNPSVSVTGSTFSSGAVSGDIVRVYYDDTTRAGGLVTYQFTIDPATAPVQTGNRHVVGAVKIPVSGTVPGKGIRGPGYIEL